jgi:hypothetical protein
LYGFIHFAVRGQLKGRVAHAIAIEKLDIVHIHGVGPGERVLLITVADLHGLIAHHSGHEKEGGKNKEEEVQPHDGGGCVFFYHLMSMHISTMYYI